MVINLQQIIHQNPKFLVKIRKKIKIISKLLIIITEQIFQEILKKIVNTDYTICN